MDKTSALEEISGGFSEGGGSPGYFPYGNSGLFHRDPYNSLL